MAIKQRKPLTDKSLLADIIHSIRSIVIAKLLEDLGFINYCHLLDQATDPAKEKKLSSELVMQ